MISFYLAHGTFIGSIRLESNKPQQVFVDSELKFGASTRTYIVREKPQMSKHAVNPSSILNASVSDSIIESEKDDSFSLITSLPESELELDVCSLFKSCICLIFYYKKVYVIYTLL